MHSSLPSLRAILCAAGCGHGTAVHRVAGCDVLGCVCAAPFGRILPPEDVPEPSAFLDKAVADDYEAQVEDLTQRLNVTAADLLETRSQRAHLARQLAAAAEQAIEHAKRHAQLFDEWVRERARLVDERDQLAKTLESEREHHKAVREYAVARQAERDEARDEVVRLGRQTEKLTKERDEAVDEADRTSDALHDLTLERNRFADELVRLRTIIGELGAAEAAEPPPDLEQVVDVSGSLRRSVAEQIGCPSCHTILNARAAGGCGDTWHWENRQQLTAEDYGRFFPERGDDGQPLGDEEIEALRREGEQ
jgi:DNA repair exonuclease SbcCD ATPase subunit